MTLKARVRRVSQAFDVRGLHLDDVYHLCLQPLAAAGLPKQTPRKKVSRFVYLLYRCCCYACSFFTCLLHSHF